MSKLNSDRLNSFGSASIPKLVLQFSVPAIISMLVNALYNVVDRFFVGQGVGSLGIAGITLCFPIFLFMMAMSMMVGVGGNTLFAIRLGQKKYIQASIILNNSFSLLILMALGAFTLGEIFMEPLLKLFGASEQTLPVASSYMRIILCGAIFQTIAPGMNHFIRSMGHPKTAMFREIVGAVTNIILDYIFIMQFHWGIEGAAWATLISQLVASALITQFFIKKDTPIKIRWRHMKLRVAYVRKIYILGLPPSVMQICNSLMNAILAWSLTTYGNISVKTTGALSGGDMAISAFGITNSIISIIILPLLGFVHGTQPIIGYNYGAHLNSRVKETLKFAFIFAGGFMFVTWAVLMWQAETFVAPFAPNDPELIKLSAWAMRIFAAAFFMIPFGMVSGNFFQGTGKALRAMFLNACRQVILLIPFLLILPHFFELKGVFMAQPIADTGAAIIGLAMLWHELKKLK
ncbi:MATE family efflux transporter [Fibrobacter sp.]|uniref:MATE family efflux transporter n=1 Tax=Fibrobacter sp. TaxID=35828 RepID=UPI00261E987E|nr:MATE family efflux transporter [Fibrobacter sp.]MDD7497903.1 MATE family efflux transporter [Fibrobacter sp.]MDY5723845.1 MATE family efflux transporter [Fibrobacter sp.]